jgi:hypothetical protein
MSGIEAILVIVKMKIPLIASLASGLYIGYCAEPYIYAMLWSVFFIMLYMYEKRVGIRQAFVASGDLGKDTGRYAAAHMGVFLSLLLTVIFPIIATEALGFWLGKALS